MPFFTKHPVPAVPCANLSISPDSLKKPRKIHSFTLKQFHGKTNQSSPNNSSKFSISRFSRSDCKTDNSADVEAQLVEQDSKPTYALSKSVSKIHEDHNSDSDLSPETNLCETSQDEECCPCLLEDSYHPDKVYKKHWYTINRKESCKINCSKRDDQKCRQPVKPFRRSFTPITRPFRRFLHQNSDNGIHYFFESTDCECYNSTESFETLFGCNTTICQACDPENDCPSIFSASAFPISGIICASDDCFSTDATLVKLNQTTDLCISLGSVFDSKTQERSTAIPVLACEGQDCSSPASFVLARETEKCAITNFVIANNEQYCSNSVDLILSCGAQECSSISSALTREKEPCSSSVDLVLGCELKECGLTCQVLDSTSHEFGSKSTLVLLGNRLGLSSTNVSALPCKELDCNPESSMLVNKSDTCGSTGTNSHVEDSQGASLVLLNTNGCAPTSALWSYRTLNSPSAISLTNEELSCREEETHHQTVGHESSEEFDHEKMSGNDKEVDSPDTGVLTRSEKSPCTDSSINRDSSKIHRFTLKQFRLKTKQKCPNNGTKGSIFRLSGSKFTNDHSANEEAHVVEQKTSPTDAVSKSVSSIHKDSHSSSYQSPDAFLCEMSRAEKCCACLLEDCYHNDKVLKKHWYTINRKPSCKNSCSKEDERECRLHRKHLKESFSQITNLFSRFLHKNSDDGIHYFFESRDCECYKSTQNFDNIFGCNQHVCQTCDTESNLLTIFSTPPDPMSEKKYFLRNCFSTDSTLVMANKPADCCVSLSSIFDGGAPECCSAIPALACEVQDCSSPASFVLQREAAQCSSSNIVIANHEQYCSSVNLVQLCDDAQGCSSVSSSPTCKKVPDSSSVDLVLGCDVEECGTVCEALDSSSQESNSKSTRVLFGNAPMLCSTDDFTPSCKGVGCAPDSIVLVNKNDPCCSSGTNSRAEDRQGGALVLTNTNGCASRSTLSPCSTHKLCSDTSFSSEELSSRKDESDQQSDEHESDEFEHESFSSTEQECGSPVSGFLTSSEKCSLGIRNLSPHMSKECF